MLCLVLRLSKVLWTVIQKFGDQPIRGVMVKKVVRTADQSPPGPTVVALCNRRIGERVEGDQTGNSTHRERTIRKKTND